MELQLSDTRQLRLDFGSSLASSDTIVIKYVKPSGDTGQWTAAASTTFATYQLTSSDIDELGKWYLQIEEVTSGVTTRGRPERVQVVEQIV